MNFVIGREFGSGENQMLTSARRFWPARIGLHSRLAKSIPEGMQTTKAPRGFGRTVFAGYIKMER
jgi:hypothetical protein